MLALSALLTAGPGNVLLAQQDYRIKVENTKDSRLSLEDFRGELPIEGYAGDEIVISTKGEGHWNETPERAKGLKPIYGGGTDNTGLGLEVVKDGKSIHVHCLLGITQSHPDYKIKVPENIYLKIKNECAGGGAIKVENMKGEIEINSCHSILLKNVSGPLVLSNISGSIEVAFKELNKDKPISIASVSGEVDITLPANAPVDLEMSTVSGSMYSDFDLQTEKNGMRKVGGGGVNYKLNGGGTSLQLHTVSGNIYLRKAGTRPA
jgi:predicted membrane protein